MQLKVFPRLLGYTSPTVNDWKNVFSPIEYKFEKIYYKLIFLMVASISLVSLAKITMSIFQSPTLMTWKNEILILLVFLIIGSWYFVRKKGISKELFFIQIFSLFYLSVIITKFTSYDIDFDIDLDWKSITAVIISLFFSLPVTYFTTLVMLDLSFSWWTITGSWLTFALVIILLFLVEFRKDREAENPLHGIIKAPKTSNTATLKRRGLGWLRWFNL